MLKYLNACENAADAIRLIAVASGQLRKQLQAVPALSLLKQRLALPLLPCMQTSTVQGANLFVQGVLLPTLLLVWLFKPYIYDSNVAGKDSFAGLSTL